MTPTKKKLAIIYFAFFLTNKTDALAQVDYDIWKNVDIKTAAVSNEGQDIYQSTNFQEYDSKIILNNIVNIGIMFFITIAIMMFMISLFKMKLAGGNEDKAINAKKTLWNAIVGVFLIIGFLSVLKLLVGAVANAVEIL